MLIYRITNIFNILNEKFSICFVYDFDLLAAFRP